MEKVNRLEQRLQTRDAKIKALEDSIQKSTDIAPKIANLFGIVSGRHKGLVEQKLEDLLNGNVTLSVKEYYQFWTDLHVDNDVIFFKCTSKINPELWMTSPDMQLYEQRQTANIYFYRNKSTEEYRKDAMKLIKEKSNISYNGESNFERIFMIDEEAARKNKNQVESLAQTIARQIKKGINVKTICIKSNEIPTFSRPQDFGIVMTYGGTKLAMYLEVDNDGLQQGGQVLFDNTKIEEFERHYIEVEKVAKQVNMENAEEIRDHILDQLTKVTDISEIYGNRCYNCLEEGEKKANSADWEKDRTPKRVWYEIIREENDLVRQVLLSKKPRDILEIGCGAGRMINLALDLEKKEGERLGWEIGNIEAYEQNNVIRNLLARKFRHDRRVIIHKGLVGRNGQTKRFYHILPEHEDQFDLVLAVSNLVGWQCDEEEWIKEVLRAGSSLFFTVYKKGWELERVRMYQASGDVVVKCTNGDIEMLVDAFENQRHRTKAYDKDEIERKVDGLASDVPLKPYSYYEGRYLHGFLLTKK